MYVVFSVQNVTKKIGLDFLRSDFSDSVIPTKGATIEIQVSTAGNYPKLTTDLDLNTTLVNASGDPVPYNAIITVFKDAELDLDAKQIKAGKIINNGVLTIEGTEGFKLRQLPFRKVGKIFLDEFHRLAKLVQIVDLAKKKMLYLAKRQKLRTFAPEIVTNLLIWERKSYS